ncbi:MAG: type III-A CRISPR-associated RAMP protein Csm3 [Melioribacter sp.]|uniref:type III-A CRISPR-associated RAMP protein Csm3 n=1 Tax=Rosettibacter primus TaxID=3111523 RepID=UPI00247B9B0D|nr:type III-A CRISPR-associated RAMP protein Csm3 [Melioribacter sp.]
MNGQDKLKVKKLIKYVKASTTIEFLTGFHIGGPKESVKIGGIDNPVIRNPITEQPYIPGSSLKGRFRMALERKYNDFTIVYNYDNEKKPISIKSVEPSSDTKNPSKVTLLFGNASASDKEDREPTRFLFRDAYLSEDSLEFAVGEEKIELKMDRQTMKGSSGGNRTQERIPAGAKFKMEVTIRVFEGDDLELFKERLEEARQIVEQEFIGGSGSRGYGQVKIEPFTFTDVLIVQENKQ